MISTIYKTTEDELKVSRMRKHPGRKSTNLKGLILFLNQMNMRNYLFILWLMIIITIKQEQILMVSAKPITLSS
jgi:hypothetical protein